MSQRNVEIVRNAFEAWNRQDYDTMSQLASPDIELDASDRVLNPDRYTGVEGFMRFRREVAEAWDRFELSIEELLEAGNRVVVFVRSIGRGKASGVEVSFRSAWLVTVSGRKITRLTLYRDRDEALDAAGLRE